MRLDLMSVDCLVITYSGMRSDIANQAAPLREVRHAQTKRSDDLQTHRRYALRRGQGCRVLGSRFAGLWGPGLSHRPKGLRCAKPGAGRSEAGDARPARRACRRSGAPEGGCCHRPYQKRPGPGSRAACARIHRSRLGGALHARACSGGIAVRTPRGATGGC